MHAAWSEYSEQTTLLEGKTVSSEKMPYAVAEVEVTRENQFWQRGGQGYNNGGRVGKGGGGSKEQPTRAIHSPTMQGASHQYPTCEF